MPTRRSRRTFVGATAALLIGPAARAEAEPFKLGRPLKVLCYNVYNGFNHGRSFKTTAAWVKTVGPDIAGWQELVGWNEAKLKEAAPAWGHTHAAALKGGGYNIGLSGVDPIKVIERRTADYHHGYLHCRTRGVDVIVTHLWPGTRRGQVREASILRDLVIRLAKEQRQVIVMGDFNAHTATDARWVNLQQPLLQRRGPGDAKRAPEDRFINNGQFNFDVMNTIFEAPLRDVVRERFPEAARRDERQLGSFPTRILPHSNTAKNQQGFLERIDFILATPALAEYCVEAKVCRSPPLLETTSDHYPVVAQFAAKGN